MKRIALLISLFLILSITFADAQTKKRKKKKRTYAVQNQPQNFNQTVVVNPGSILWIPVYLEKPSRLSGRFFAQGGRNDIQCMIVDSDGLTNLKNGHKAKMLYISGTVTVDNFDVNLPSGLFYIVFNNRIALLTNKVVTVSYSTE